MGLMSCMSFPGFWARNEANWHIRILFVFDPTDMEGYNIPLGKQRLVPSHIFYTPCSGIWQTVWLESAPANHITQLDVSADMYGKGNVTALHGSCLYQRTNMFSERYGTRLRQY